MDELNPEGTRHILRRNPKQSPYIYLEDKTQKKYKRYGVFYIIQKRVYLKLFEILLHREFQVNSNY